MQEQKLKITRSEIIGISGLIAFVVFLIIIFSQIDLTFVNKYIEGAGIWAPVLFVLAKASTIVFAPLSGTPLYVLAGTLFGIEQAIIYVFIGDLLGFSTVFFLGRFFGLSVINKITNKKELGVIKLIQKQTGDVKSFIRSCLIFFWFPEAVVAASGLGKLSYLTVIGIFIPIYSCITAILIFISTKILV